MAIKRSILHRRSLACDFPRSVRSTRFEVRGSRYEERRRTGAHTEARQWWAASHWCYEKRHLLTERERMELLIARYTQFEENILRNVKRNGIQNRYVADPVAPLRKRVNLATRFYYVLFMKLEGTSGIVSFGNSYIACP